MVYIGMIIAGIIGFIIGEGISAAIRNDASGKENNSTLTWVLKLSISIILMTVIFKSCS